MVLQTEGLIPPELQVTVFLKSLVPEVTQDVVEKTWELLKKMVWKDGKPSYLEADIDMTGLVRVIGKEERWGWYETLDPRETKESEDTVYRHIRDISDCIIKAAEITIPDQNPTARFRCRSTEMAWSDAQNSNYRTDAGMELVHSGTNDREGSRANLRDSVVNAEFKRSDTDEEINQNSEQMIRNAAHMLYNDPGRRFRFGLTIENCRTRLWFFSRAISYVTEGFDFVRNPKPFIQFILALSFASEEDMGYDLTVKRVAFDGQWVYDYQVVDTEGKRTCYRTKSLIQSIRSVGRAVRVEEVWVLDNKGYPVEEEFDGKMTRVAALKDCRLAVNRPPEPDMQEAILKAYQEPLDDQREIEDLRRYFMEIFCDITVSAGGTLDVSDTHFRDGALEYNRMCELVRNNPYLAPKPSILSGVNSKISRGIGGGFSRTEEDGRIMFTSDRPNDSLQRVYQARKHTRIVFEEIGVRLDDIEDQQVLIDCLVDALSGASFLSQAGNGMFIVTAGLEMLYVAQWVHRDMSPGNMLRCYNKLDGRYVCKVTDLEYARPFQAEAGLQHDRKMMSSILSYDPLVSHLNGNGGTPAFVAVEVQINRYLFIKPERSDALKRFRRPKEQGSSAMSAESIRPRLPEPPRQPANPIPFFHNYLHDIEAIWWIMIWHLFSTVPETMALTRGEYNKRTSYAEKLFPASLEGNVTRSLLIAIPGEYSEHHDRLCKEYEELGNLMGQALEILRDLYKSAERPLEEVTKYESYDGVHDLMRRVFTEAKEHALPQVKYLDRVRRELDQELPALGGRILPMKRPNPHPQEEGIADEPPPKIRRSGPSRPQEA